jgi:hypothetical protein
MLESVEDRLHEFVVEGHDLIVVQLQPLDRVEVFESVQRKLREAKEKNETVVRINNKNKINI